MTLNCEIHTSLRRDVKRYCFSNHLVNRVFWFVSQLFRCLFIIDGVMSVMPFTIFDKLNLVCIRSTFFKWSIFLHCLVNAFAMVCHIKPISYIFAIPKNRNFFTINGIYDNLWDKFFLVLSW